MDKLWVMRIQSYVSPKYRRKHRAIIKSAAKRGPWWYGSHIRRHIALGTFYPVSLCLKPLISGTTTNDNPDALVGIWCHRCLRLATRGMSDLSETELGALQ